MQFQTVSSILLIITLTLTSTQSGEIITSPLITDWGVWGAFQRCPSETFAQGFQLRTESYKGPLIDDTATNALRLFCVDPRNASTYIISSLEGHWGDWGEIFTCGSGGFIYGFELRVEQPFLIDDETATNNMRFYCTNQPADQYIEGDGTNFGAWRDWRKCARTEALCGLQTQIQPDQGIASDDTAFNNLAAECCDLPK